MSGANPSELHLDHADDRSGYIGLSHAECNREAAGPLARIRMTRRTCSSCQRGFKPWSVHQQRCVPCIDAALAAVTKRRAPSEPKYPSSQVYYYECTICGKVGVQRRGRARVHCGAESCRAARQAQWDREHRERPERKQQLAEAYKRYRQTELGKAYNRNYVKAWRQKHS